MPKDSFASLIGVSLFKLSLMMVKMCIGLLIRTLRFQLSIIQVQEMTSLLFVFMSLLRRNSWRNQTSMCLFAIEMAKIELGLGKSFLMRLICLVKLVLQLGLRKERVLTSLDLILLNGILHFMEQSVQIWSQQEFILLMQVTHVCMLLNTLMLKSLCLKIKHKWRNTSKLLIS